LNVRADFVVPSQSHYLTKTEERVRVIYDRMVKAPAPALAPAVSDLSAGSGGFLHLSTHCLAVPQHCCVAVGRVVRAAFVSMAASVLRCDEWYLTRQLCSLHNQCWLSAANSHQFTESSRGVAVRRRLRQLWAVVCTLHRLHLIPDLCCTSDTRNLATSPDLCCTSHTHTCTSQRGLLISAICSALNPVHFCRRTTVRHHSRLCSTQVPRPPQ
jgi:hypothetical protein